MNKCFKVTLTVTVLAVVTSTAVVADQAEDPVPKRNEPPI